MMTSNHKIDFAIITALPVELDAVLSKLGHYESVGRKSDRLPFYRAEIGQTQVLVTRSEAGNIKAALAAATLLERYHPEYLLMVGMAAGAVGLLRYIESGVFQSLPTRDDSSPQDTTLLAKLQQIEQAVEILRQERVATKPGSLTEAEETEQAIQQEIIKIQESTCNSRRRWR